MIPEMTIFDAAELWANHGKDNDFLFGYSEEELKRVLKSRTADSQGRETETED